MVVRDAVTGDLYYRWLPKGFSATCKLLLQKQLPKEVEDAMVDIRAQIRASAASIRAGILSQRVK